MAAAKQTKKAPRKPSKSPKSRPKPKAAEVEALLKECRRRLDKGDLLSTLRYEEGIEDAIEWIFGRGDYPLN